MILIVTHQEDFGQRTSRGLQERGYPATFTCEGEAALRSAAQTSPALALVDVYLQDLSGLEVFCRLRHQGYREKVILLSGVSMRTEVPEALHLGVDRVLGPPLALEQLESATRSVIGAPQPPVKPPQDFPSHASSSSLP